MGGNVANVLAPFRLIKRKRSRFVPFPRAKIAIPGENREMDPKPDHGKVSYTGSGRLTGKAALIIGADSGIGRAGAIAFARESADVVLSYLDERDDAMEAASWVETAGRLAVIMPGNVSEEAHCLGSVARLRLDAVDPVHHAGRESARIRQCLT